MSCKVAWGALLVAAGLAVSGCGIESQGKLLAPGTPRPKLEAEGWFNGEPPEDSQLAGKVLVLDFWAHWCGPCREAAPELVAISERFSDQDVVFLGFTSDGADQINQCEEFVKSGTIPWPNGFGAGTTFDAFGVYQIPTVYVIDRQGNVAWHDGLPGSIESAIAEALGPKTN